MRISFNPEATAEAEAATLWYKAEGGSKASQRFAAEVRRAVELAAIQPNVGAPGKRGTRILPVHKFPYSIVYRIQSARARRCPPPASARVLGEACVKHLHRVGQSKIFPCDPS